MRYLALALVSVFFLSSCATAPSDSSCTPGDEQQCSRNPAGERETSRLPDRQRS